MNLKLSSSLVLSSTYLAEMPKNKVYTQDFQPKLGMVTLVLVMWESFASPEHGGVALEQPGIVETVPAQGIGMR